MQGKADPGITYSWRFNIFGCQVLLAHTFVVKLTINLKKIDGQLHLSIANEYGGLIWVARR